MIWKERNKEISAPKGKRMGWNKGKRTSYWNDRKVTNKVSCAAFPQKAKCNL